MERQKDAKQVFESQELEPTLEGLDSPQPSEEDKASDRSSSPARNAGSGDKAPIQPRRSLRQQNLQRGNTSVVSVYGSEYTREVEDNDDYPKEPELDPEDREVMTIEDDEDEGQKSKAQTNTETLEVSVAFGFSQEVVAIEDDEPKQIIIDDEDSGKKKKRTKISEEKQGKKEKMEEEKPEKGKLSRKNTPSGYQAGKQSQDKKVLGAERILQPMAREGEDIPDDDSIAVSKEDEENQQEDLNEFEEEKQGESQEEGGEPCKVCYSKVSKEFLQAETRHLFDMIHCSKCGVSAHHICYGIGTQVTEKKDGKTGKVTKTFLCRQCEKAADKQKCFVCNSEEGCLFPGGNKNWVHVLCAISSPGIKFKDVVKMGIDMNSFKKDTVNIRNVKKCDICSVKVGTFECDNERRVNHCHLNCALKAACLNLKSNHWKISFGIQPREKFALQADISEQDVLDKIEDVALKLNSVTEEAGQGSIYSNLDDTKGKKVSKSKSSSSKGDVKALAEKLFKKTSAIVDEEYGEELKRQGIEHKDIDESTKHMGGKLKVHYIESEENESMEVEAEGKQSKKKLSEKEKIAAIKALGKEINDIGVLLEDFEKENKLYRVKADFRALPLIDNLTFPEVLFFVNVFQRRIEATQNNLCNYEDIKTVISMGPLLPFSVAGLLMPLYEKYCAALATDFLAQRILQHCEPESAYNPKRRKFDEEVIRRNKNAIEEANQLQRIYLSPPCQVVTPKLQKLSKFIEQLDFLEAFYKEMLDTFNYPELRASPARSRLGSAVKGTPANKDELPNFPISRMIILHKNANEVELPDELQEMKLIKQYTNQSENIRAIVEEQLEVNNGEEKRSRSPSMEVEGSPRRSPRRTANKEKASPVPKSGKASQAPPKRAPKESTTNKLTVPGKISIADSGAGKTSVPQTLSIPIPIPRSPKSSVVAKGKSMKNDKAWNDIESEFKIESRVLQDKMTLEEAQEKLTEERNDDLERKVQRALRWKEDYEEALERNRGELGQLVNEIESVGLRMEEMERALEYKRDWRLWRIKVTSVNRRLKKKVEDIFQQTDEMVSFEEVQNLVEEGDEIKHIEPDEGFFSEVKGKLDNVKVLQEYLKEGKNEDGTPLHYKQLKNIENQLRSNNIQIPEIKFLQELLEVNKNVQQLVDETLDVEELERRAQELSSTFDVADQGLTDAVRRKIAEGKKIKEQAETILLTKSRYNLEDLTHTALLCKQAKTEKLNIKETDQLRKVVDNFLVFQNAVAILIEGEPMTLENLENGEYLSLKDRQIEDFLDESVQLLESMEDIEKEKLKKLKEVSNSVDLKDVKIFNIFFEKLLTLIWKEDAKNLLTAETQKSSKDIERVLNNMPHISNTREEDMEFFARIQQEGEKIAEWKKAVSELLGDQPEGELLDIIEKAYEDEPDYISLKTRLEEMKIRVIRLQTWFANELSGYTDLVDENKALQRLVRWTNWIADTLDMIRQVEEQQRPLNYDKIKTAMEDIEELGLPKDRGICRVIVEWYGKVEDIRKQYLKDYQQKKPKISSHDVENVKVRRLIEKNAGKQTLAEAHSVLQNLRSTSKFAFMAQEIESVNFDIHSAEQWATKIQETLENYDDVFDIHETEEGNRNPLAIKEDEIIKTMKELKVQMVELPLRDEKAENEFVLLEWICDASFLLNGLRRESTYDDWVRLVGAGEKLQESGNSKVERLLQLLKYELYEAEKLREFLTKMKRLEAQQQNQEGEQRKMSVEEVNEMMESFEKARVPLREEKKELERYFSKWKSLKERSNKILHPEGEKSVLREFVSMQEHIRKSPIDMSKEYKELDDAIVEANRLESELRRQLFEDFNSMEELVQRYKKCPVFINGLDKMNKTYEDAKSGYEKVKAKEAEILDSESNSLSYEELVDLGMEIDNLDQVKIDPSLKKLKKYIFVKKCNKLQSQSREGFAKPSTTVPYLGLKNLLHDGFTLKKQFGDDAQITTSIHFVDNLYKEAEKRVREVEREKDLEKLDNMPKVVLGFVDISSVIIERRADLTSRPAQTNPNLRFIDFKEDTAQRNRREQEKEQPKRKRGRPRKGEEKNPPKPKDKSVEGKRKSKDKSREQERLKVVRRKSPPRTGSWLNGKERPMKKLSEYFGAAAPIKDFTKKPLKETDTVVVAIKNVLERSGEILKLNYAEGFKYAKIVCEAYPEMLKSAEILNKVKYRLQNILKYRGISKMLLQKQFDKTFFKHLMTKTNPDLESIEKAIREREREKSLKARKTSGALSDEDDAAIRRKSKDASKKEDRGMVPSSQRHKEATRSPSPFQVKKPVKEQKTTTSFERDTKRKQSGEERSKTPQREEKLSTIFGKMAEKKKEEPKPAEKSKFRYDDDASLSPWEGENSRRSASKTTKEQPRPSPYKVFEGTDYSIKRRPGAPKTSSAAYDPMSAMGADYGMDSMPYDDYAEPVPETRPTRPVREERSSEKFIRSDKKSTAEKETKKPGLFTKDSLSSKGATKATVDTSKNPTLKIFEGSIEYDKDRSFSMIALFTCDDTDLVKKIPRLVEDKSSVLRIQKRLPKTEVDSYINRTLNSLEEKNLRVISGWLEYRISLYQSRGDQIARDLLDSNQMCTISCDNKSTRIIFMHRDQMAPEWKNRLNFRVKKVHKASNPSLYFMIITKPDLITSRTKFTEPVVEKTSKEKREENSEPSSIEDYEPNFADLIEDKESLASLEGEMEESSPDRGWEDDHPPRRRHPKESLNRKRHYDDFNDDDEEEDEYDIEKKVKIDFDEDRIVDQLKGMDPYEIAAFAKSLDRNNREKIMKLLAKCDEEEMKPKKPTYVETNPYLESENNILQLQKERERATTLTGAPFMGRNYGVFETGFGGPYTGASSGQPGDLATRFGISPAKSPIGGPFNTTVMTAMTGRDEGKMSNLGGTGPQIRINSGKNTPGQQKNTPNPNNRFGQNGNRFGNNQRFQNQRPGGNFNQGQNFKSTSSTYKGQQQQQQQQRNFGQQGNQRGPQNNNRGPNNAGQGNVYDLQGIKLNLDENQQVKSMQIPLSLLNKLNAGQGPVTSTPGQEQEFNAILQSDDTVIRNYFGGDNGQPQRLEQRTTVTTQVQGQGGNVNLLETSLLDLQNLQNINQTNPKP